MTIKIGQKIVGYEVKRGSPEQAPAPEQATAPMPQPAETGEADTPEKPADPMANVVQMHERLERPEMLLGSTYKVKTPLSEHALYVTINDIVLNPGTPYEKRRPFEIFINSKNMDHFQWIVALTRIISAVFRKGGDATFLVEELRGVFDPRGGYFKRGGKYMPSLVAEIGDAIEAHMKMIGMIKDEGLEPHQQAHIEAKRAELAARKGAADALETQTDGEIYPADARLCSKCQTKAVVLLDGCLTCLSCGDSKCG